MVTKVKGPLVEVEIGGTTTDVSDYLNAVMRDNYTEARALDFSKLPVGQHVQVSGHEAPWEVVTGTLPTDNGFYLIPDTASGSKYLKSTSNDIRLSILDSVSSSTVQSLIDEFSEIKIDVSFTSTEIINIPDNRTIKFEKNSEITWAYSGNLFNVGNNVKIYEPHCTGPSEFYHTFVTEYGVGNIEIVNPIITNANLIQTAISTEYADADISTLGENFVIRNPKGIRSTVAAAGAFIYPKYVKNFFCYGGSCPNYFFGVQYWGGDANPAIDGARANDRKAINLFFYDFDADSTEHAGMWGSMGNCVRFVNCTSRRDSVGGDVGIDHEGSLDAKNIGCTSSFWANGNYAVFSSASDVEHINCNGYQLGGYPQYRNYNSSQDNSLGADISFFGGHYETTDISTSGTLSTFDDDNGCFRSFKMQKVNLQDVGISCTANNMGHLEISADISVTAATGSAVDYIYVNSNSSSRKMRKINNTNVLVNSGVTITAGSSAVHMQSSSPNYANIFICSDCDTGGIGVKYTETGTNAGVSGTVSCHDNITPSITVTNSGAKNMTIARDDGNTNIAGVVVTS